MITPTIIKKMRTDAGLTQSELAKLVKVSQAHIAKIENNKVDPRLSTVNKILNVLSTKTKRLCGHIMTEKIFTVNKEDGVKEGIRIMQVRDISQLPVVDDGNIVGVLTEWDIMNHLDDLNEKTVSQTMGEPLPQVAFSTPVESVQSLFEIYPAIIVTKKGKPAGIITKSDLIRTRTE